MQHSKSEGDAFSSGRSPAPRHIAGNNVFEIFRYGMHDQIDPYEHFPYCAILTPCCGCIAVETPHFIAGLPSETFYFLDGVRLFLACCAQDEIMELACICREGGACRYPKLNPLITHIVVRQLPDTQMLSFPDRFLSFPQSHVSLGYIFKCLTPVNV